MGHRVARELAVIVHADVASSTALVQLDETLAHERIQDAFHRFSDTIKRYHGLPLEIRGDALVAEFSRASDAIGASLSFQAANADLVSGLPDPVRPVLRIGIAMGEVVVAHNTVTGDGVVLAQRLEQLAEPGAVVIQGAAHETVPKRLPFDYTDLGEVGLKGFNTPVRAYTVRTRPGETIPAPESRPWNTFGSLARSRRNLVLAGSLTAMLAFIGIWISLSPSGQPGAPGALAERPASLPSLLVLPFVNNSADPAQDYFVDGISEDIITGLSRLSNLTVLAWSTSLSLKGKTVPLQDIGKELGVHYVLDGSVRKSGDRLRITATLVDTRDNKQLWAERYDRKVSDVFALQDDVTRKIVQALAVRLTATEQGQLGRPATNNLAAYESFLRGQKYYGQNSREGMERAREAYQRAIELDPAYARAYGGIALTLMRDAHLGWAEAPLENRERALALAKQAVALGSNIPQTYWALGFVHLYRKEYKDAEDAVTRAIQIAPNYADGYGMLALIYNEQGKSKEALEYITRGMRLNPYYTWDYPYNVGRAYYQLGKYPEAITALEKAQARNENALPVKLFLAASYVAAGRASDAEWVIEQLKLLSPETTISHLEKASAISNPELKRTYLSALREAGLPE